MCLINTRHYARCGHSVDKIIDACAHRPNIVANCPVRRHEDCYFPGSFGVGLLCPICMWLRGKKTEAGEVWVEGEYRGNYSR
jgi:hypothetical protein